MNTSIEEIVNWNPADNPTRCGVWADVIRCTVWASLRDVVVYNDHKTVLPETETIPRTGHNNSDGGRVHGG